MLFGSARAQLAIGLNGTSQPCRFSVLQCARVPAEHAAVAKEAMIEQARATSNAVTPLLLDLQGLARVANEIPGPSATTPSGTARGILARYWRKGIQRLTEVIQRNNPNPEDRIF